jgi:hypothetical protein
MRCPRSVLCSPRRTRAPGARAAAAAAAAEAAAAVAAGSARGGAVGVAGAGERTPDPIPRKPALAGRLPADAGGRPGRGRSSPGPPHGAAARRGIVNKGGKSCPRSVLCSPPPTRQAPGRGPAAARAAAPARAAVAREAAAGSRVAGSVAAVAGGRTPDPDRMEPRPGRPAARRCERLAGPGSPPL